MVWLQVAELPQASVAVQVRLILAAVGQLPASVSSENVTVRFGSQSSAKVGVPKAGVAGHWMVSSPGQEVTSGAVWSSTVMVWLHEDELPQASVAVQVRRTLLTAGQLAASVSSENVTVRLESHASVKTGVPNAGCAGHWMVSSAGQSATTGAVWSSAVMVWLQVAELPQASVAVQVRRTRRTAGQFAGSVSSANVTVRFGSQLLVKLGSPKLGWAGHSMVRSPGQEATVGAEWFSSVMVWLQVAELPQASVAVQVRRTRLAAGQLAVRVSSANVTLRFWSQSSAKVGVPKAGVAGHCMVSSPGQEVTIGACVSFTCTTLVHVLEHEGPLTTLRVKVNAFPQSSAAATVTDCPEADPEIVPPPVMVQL